MGQNSTESEECVDLLTTCTTTMAPLCDVGSVKANCRKTCNACDYVFEPEDTTLCLDKETDFCKTVTLSHCVANFDVQQKCRKTCGVCKETEAKDEGETTDTAPVNRIEDESDDSCEDLMDSCTIAYCKDPQNTDENSKLAPFCAKTCGLCPGKPASELSINFEACSADDENLDFTCQVIETPGIQECWNLLLFGSFKPANMETPMKTCTEQCNRCATELNRVGVKTNIIVHEKPNNSTQIAAEVDDFLKNSTETPKNSENSEKAQETEQNINDESDKSEKLVKSEDAGSGASKIVSALVCFAVLILV